MKGFVLARAPADARGLGTGEEHWRGADNAAPAAAGAAASAGGSTKVKQGNSDAQGIGVLEETYRPTFFVGK